MGKIISSNNIINENSLLAEPPAGSASPATKRLNSQG